MGKSSGATRRDCHVLPPPPYAQLHCPLCGRGSRVLPQSQRSRVVLVHVGADDLASYVRCRHCGVYVSEAHVREPEMEPRIVEYASTRRKAGK